MNFKVVRWWRSLNHSVDQSSFTFENFDDLKMGFDVTVLGTSGNRKMKRCPGLSLKFQGRGDLSTIQLIGHLLPSNFEYLKMGFDVSIGTPSTVLIRSRPSFDLTFSELRFSPRTAVHPRISSASQLM